MRGIALAALGATAAALVAAPVASADERVIAGFVSSGYVNPDVSIERGEKLTFLNPDIAPHDVTSIEPGLFASETVSAPAEVPVTGADALEPGSYDFLCSLHRNMTGTLTVTGAGGGASGGADSKAPKLSVRVLDESVSSVLDAGALGLRVRLDEAATVRVVATSGKATVAKGRRKLTAGGGKLAARLTGAGKRALRGARGAKLALRLVAQDAAGNAAKAAATAKLR